MLPMLRLSKYPIWPRYISVIRRQTDGQADGPPTVYRYRALDYFQNENNFLCSLTYLARKTNNNQFYEIIWTVSRRYADSRQPFVCLFVNYSPSAATLL